MTFIMMLMRGVCSQIECQTLLWHQQFPVGIGDSVLKPLVAAQQCVIANMHSACLQELNCTDSLQIPMSKSN